MSRWRVVHMHAPLVAKSLLYRDDVCVAVLSSPEIAAEIVAAMPGSPGMGCTRRTHCAGCGAPYELER